MMQSSTPGLSAAAARSNGAAQACWYSIKALQPSAPTGAAAPNLSAAAAPAAAGAAPVAEAEVLIYGDIGESWFEETVTARAFVAELAALRADRITVRLNSFGGSVPDGLAIFNALRRHPARITTVNDGAAYSIASLIMMAGDERQVAANSLTMLHAPWSGVMGNAAEMRAMADVLDQHAKAMATSYASATGRSADEILPLLTDGADHWFTAADAVAFGLAQQVYDAPAEEADALAQARVHMQFLARRSAARGQPARPASPAPGLPGAPGGAQLSATAAAAAALVAAGAVPQPSARTAADPTESPAASVAAQPPETSAMTVQATTQPQAAVTNAALQPAAAAAPDVAAAAAAAHQAGAQAEAQRQAALRTVVANLGPMGQMADVQALLTTATADVGYTSDRFNAELLSVVARGAAPARPGPGVVETVAHERDKIVAASVQALMARLGASDPVTRQRVVLDAANPFRGYTLMDMARASLQRAGVRTDGMDKRALVAAAFTQGTGDFPILLENAMHKTLLGAYATAPDTWSRFCRIGSVSDFREHKRYRVGGLSNLEAVSELGEFRNKAIPDGEKARISVTTKGNIINLSREAIINDDLGAFMGLAQALGRAARRTIEADVYALFALNSGAGPTMEDGQPLFHSSHNNIAGTNAVPSMAAFEAARVLMAGQMDINTVEYLDLRPALWLGPLSVGGQARQTNAAEYDDEANKQQRRPNISRGLVRDVVDTPRLSGTAWYLLADPADAPVFEVAFLDGVQEPFMEMEQGFDVDGSRWKVRHDFGVAAIDYRGAVKNAGA